MDASAVVSALIGAIIGSLGAQALSHWLAGRRETKEASQLLVRNYLVQLQDALESLWHRIDNLAFRGGEAVVDDPDYYRLSSLYVLGSFLAQKRGLILDGVYGHLESLNEGSGSQLEMSLEAVERTIGRERDGRAGFPRYYRRELGDMTMSWSGDSWRLKSYSEFKSSLSTDQPANSAVAAAEGFLRSMDADVAAELLSAVEDVGDLVTQWTHVRMSYEDRRPRSGQTQPGSSGKI